MPRHEFRTIEEFVMLLEDEERKARVEYLSERSDRTKKYQRAIGRVIAMNEVARIVRSSNIGIVFPYSEEDCPGHVSASQKICYNCGAHIDSLRPD